MEMACWCIPLETCPHFADIILINSQILFPSFLTKLGGYQQTGLMEEKVCNYNNFFAVFSKATGSSDF